MNTSAIVGLLGGALFLYWVVQDPIGAAAVISHVFEWVVYLLQLIASRLVQFLSALL